MGLLAITLLLAPGFVVGASLAARRFGARIGGLIAGLPVVVGPILLVYALAHGRAFAAGAAAGTLLGLVSLIAFVVVYAHLAGRVFWGASLIAGWLARSRTPQRATDELLRLLRGLISGFGAFALFCFALAVSLHRLDIAAAFALATALALFTQGATLALARGERAAIAVPES